MGGMGERYCLGCGTRRAYNNALAATNREITNVATALAEQTAWTFQGIDLFLGERECLKLSSRTFWSSMTTLRFATC
jgi:hypothetical protein